MEPNPKPTFDPKDIEQNKGVAVLSYLWILFAIPLFLKRDSKFSQAVLLFIPTLS